MLVTNHIARRMNGGFVNEQVGLYVEVPAAVAVATNAKVLLVEVPDATVIEFRPA